MFELLFSKSISCNLLMKRDDLAVLLVSCFMIKYYNSKYWIIYKQYYTVTLYLLNQL